MEVAVGRWWLVLGLLCASGICSSAAAQDVQTAISQAIRRLPDDMDPPTLRKVNPADAPIMGLRSERSLARVGKRSRSTPISGTERTAQRAALAPPVLCERTAAAAGP